MKNKPWISGRNGRSDNRSNRNVLTNNNSHNSNIMGVQPCDSRTTARSTPNSDRAGISKNKKKSKKSNKKQQIVSAACLSGATNNIKGEDVSSTKPALNIADLSHFPPLQAVNSRAATPTEVSVTVAGGTTYYMPNDGQPSSLDATATPFYGAYSAADAEAVPVQEGQWVLEAAGSDTKDEAGADGTGYTPGDVYYESLAVTLTDGEPSELELMMREGIRQAVDEQVRLQQSTFMLPDMMSKNHLRQLIFDDFALWYPLESTPGFIEDKENMVYLARHKSGKALAVRQIHNFALRNLRPHMIAQAWKRVSHPNVVQLHSITTSYRNEGNSVLFAYDYHQNARTLQAFCNDERYAVSETLVWSFITQLISGIRAVHREDLAVEVLSPQRVLVTAIDNCTVRINCVAITEVIQVAGYSQCRPQMYLQGDYRDIQRKKRNDLIDLGKVMVYMISYVKMPSVEIECFAERLVSGQLDSVSDAMAQLGSHAFDHLDNIQIHKDVLEGEICKALDNDRLFKLLHMVEQVIRTCPLSRSAFSASSSFREDNTGRENIHDEQHTLIHLFDKFLHGQTSLHEFSSVLNHLDAGTDKKILLRGHKCAYMVSYRELRDIFWKPSWPRVLIESGGCTSSCDDSPPAKPLQSRTSFCRYQDDALRHERVAAHHGDLAHLPMDAIDSVAIDHQQPMFQQPPPPLPPPPPQQQQPQRQHQQQHPSPAQFYVIGLPRQYQL